MHRETTIRNMRIIHESIDQLRSRYTSFGLSSTPKLSFICVYNDKKKVEDYLIRSLFNQSGLWELILVNNIKGDFVSAAKALNFGAQVAKGIMLCFVHQDIEFVNDDCVSKIYEMMVSLQDRRISIAGVAGKSYGNKEMVSNIDSIRLGRRVSRNVILKPVEVQTVDCCLIVVPSIVFAKIKFDETVCSDWHFYAEDYCLVSKDHGIGVYVLPIHLVHYSNGINISLIFSSITDGYYDTLEKMLVKHKHEVVLYTTTGVWRTRWPLAISKLKRYVYYSAFYVLKYINEFIN